MLILEIHVIPSELHSYVIQALLIAIVPLYVKLENLKELDAQLITPQLLMNVWMVYIVIFSIAPTKIAVQKKLQVLLAHKIKNA